MTLKITYQQLVDEFSAKTGRTKAFSKNFIKDIFFTIQEGLRRDENVNIKGLGIFKLQDVPARENVNPKTGKTTLIEAHKKVVFKPEKALREKVNAQYEKLSAKTIKKKEPKKAPVPEKAAVPDIPAPKEEKVLPKKESMVFGTAHDLPSGDKLTTSPPKSDKKVMPTFIIEEKKRKSAWRWIVPLLLIIMLIVLLYIIPVKFDSLEKYAFWQSDKRPDKTETSALTDEKTSREPDMDDIFIKAPKPEKPEVKTSVEKKEEIDLTPVQNDEKSFIHIIKPDNTLWGLSVQYYSRASLWPNIYRKNVESLRTPDLLIVGRELLIPELQGGSFQLSKVDSARIAQGYYLAYRSYKKYDPGKAEGYLKVAKTFSTTIK
jgi:nucleoid DNA-binding protein